MRHEYGMRGRVLRGVGPRAVCTEDNGAEWGRGWGGEEGGRGWGGNNQQSTSYKILNHCHQSAAHRADASS